MVCETMNHIDERRQQQKKKRIQFCKIINDVNVNVERTTIALLLYNVCLHFTKSFT